MEEYDGWTLKTIGRKDYFRSSFFRTTRQGVIRVFEELLGKGSWRRYRRRGYHKIVKVKLVEV